MGAVQAGQQRSSTVWGQPPACQPATATRLPKPSGLQLAYIASLIKINEGGWVPSVPEQVMGKGNGRRLEIKGCCKVGARIERPFLISAGHRLPPPSTCSPKCGANPSIQEMCFLHGIGWCGCDCVCVCWGEEPALPFACAKVSLLPPIPLLKY